MLAIVLFVSVLLGIYGSEVVILDSKNFEKLTQASTGSTTGDWMVKFYAPWCGHCKKLEPVWEEVAEELKGVVNVAKVDVMQNRELGTRFEIKGFPTVKLLSKGKIYDYQGRRTKDDLIEFAKGGYQITEPVPVPGELGWFGEIAYVFRHAFKQAGKDIKRGNYFTVDVVLMMLPVVFLFVLLMIVFLPSGEMPNREQEARIPNESSSINAAATKHAAAPTSASDNAKKDD